MVVNTLLKVLEQLLHKIKANRRREMVLQQKDSKQEDADGEQFNYVTHGTHAICDTICIAIRHRNSPRSSSSYASTCLDYRESLLITFILLHPPLAQIRPLK